MKAIQLERRNILAGCLIKLQQQTVGKSSQQYQKLLLLEVVLVE
jgi:hypothetical protein